MNDEIRWIEKVTALIIRKSGVLFDLLLFEHPFAGIQIPAGTVEPGETPEHAVLREAREESGLNAFTLRKYLGCQVKKLPQDQLMTLKNTRVFARPDQSSFDWGYLRRGLQVEVLRRSQSFTQISYLEYDRVPDPQYVSMQITGWVSDDALAAGYKRHYFLLEFQGQSQDRWMVSTDNHIFQPFWASLATLPALIPPQEEWLKFLPKDIQKLLPDNK